MEGTGGGEANRHLCLAGHHTGGSSRATCKDRCPGECGQGVEFALGGGGQEGAWTPWEPHNPCTEFLESALRGNLG